VRSSMADFRLPALPSMLQDKRFLLWLAFGLSWGGVVIALVLQHGFDMQPCAWCTVQRGIYLIVGALALLALIVPGGVASGVVAMLAARGAVGGLVAAGYQQDRKSTRLNSSHVKISYAVFCLKYKMLFAQ